jgi:AraC family transcriptional regulator
LQTCQILRTHADGYAARINRAIDLIVRDLAQPLALADIAQAAGFSAFHFHRVFKGVMGETLNQFIKRLRLERALYLMSHAPGRSLTDVALDCGFASSSDFSRCFRQHFGAAPRRFDLDGFRQVRRAEMERILAQQATGPRAQPAPEPGEGAAFEVRLRDLPARTVAYVRVFQPYRPGAAEGAFEQLLQWASARGLEGGQWLGYMWDEPEIVALADCRYDVALVVDAACHDGAVGRYDFPAMRVAEIEVRGPIELEMRALEHLYDVWLPTSGYLPADQPCFESWSGLPFAHGTAHFELSCQLPVIKA